MSETGEFHEGQTVIIVGREGRPDDGRQEVTVKTVGRTLVHVETSYGYVSKFRLVDGWEANGLTHRRVWTTEGLAAKARHDDLTARLRAVGVNTFHAHLSVAQLEAIAAIVEDGQ